VALLRQFASASSSRSGVVVPKRLRDLDGRSRSCRPLSPRRATAAEARVGDMSWRDHFGVRSSRARSAIPYSVIRMSRDAAVGRVSVAEHDIAAGPAIACCVLARISRIERAPAARAPSPTKLYCPPTPLTTCRSAGHPIRCAEQRGSENGIDEAGLAGAPLLQLLLAIKRVVYEMCVMLIEARCSSLIRRRPSYSDVGSSRKPPCMTMPPLSVSPSPTWPARRASPRCRDRLGRDFRRASRSSWPSSANARHAGCRIVAVPPPHSRRELRVYAVSRPAARSSAGSTCSVMRRSLSRVCSTR